jgi:hypothetical protein
MEPVEAEPDDVVLELDSEGSSTEAAEDSYLILDRAKFDSWWYAVQVLLRDPFATVSPMAFEDPGHEKGWNRQYMSGVAYRLSTACKVMAVFLLLMQLQAIFNPGNKRIMEEHWILMAIVVPVEFIGLMWVSVAASKREDASTGIQALYVIACVILAGCTTTTSWIYWESHHYALVTKGSPDIALAGWAQVPTHSCTTILWLNPPLPRAGDRLGAGVVLHLPGADVRVRGPHQLAHGVPPRRRLRTPAHRLLLRDHRYRVPRRVLARPPHLPDDGLHGARRLSLVSRRAPGPAALPPRAVAGEPARAEAGGVQAGRS